MKHSNAPKPAWQVNPRAKGTSPEIAAAYRAKTLRLITLDFGAFIGYSYTADPATTVDSLLEDPRIGASFLRAKAVTIEPYPYAREV